MTGFASQQLTVSFDQTSVNATITIKSLNSRFFEATCKLPPAFTALETEIHSLCRAQLRRGHIYFTLQISPSTMLKTEVEVALPVVESYVRAVEKIQKQLSIPGTFTITDLVQLPHVFAVEEKLADEAARTAILEAATKVLQQVTAVRVKEGQAIAQDMVSRSQRLTKDVQAIAQRAATLMEQRKADIAGKIAQLGYSNDQVLETHRVALYNELMKTDVTEEIVRLQSHLKNLSSIVSSAEVEKGKRLDFTLQEMLREVNTIASKSADASIGALVIECKVELEKIREQVQNVV